MSIDDLSEGNVNNDAQETGQKILRGQYEDRIFKYISFGVGWITALIFLGAVLCFSYQIVKNPDQYLLSTYETTQPADSKWGKEATSSSEKPKIEADVKDVFDEDKAHKSSAINQMLILLGILSAVGMTLAVSVMRFSFADNNKPKDDSTPLVTSPGVETLKLVSETLLAALGKKKD